MPVITCRDLKQPEISPIAGSVYDAGPDVHIWHINPFLCDISHPPYYLGASELQKSAMLRDDADRKRYTVSHYLLRLLLGKYLDRQPGEILFSADSRNKPYAIQESTNMLHFNLSHSGDCVVIALACSHAGIDVEHTSRNLDFMELLTDYFDDREIVSIKNAEDPRRAFYRLWTRKEALVKATGKGSGDYLKFISCLDGDQHVNAADSGSKENWLVNSFELPGQYTGAIANSPEIRSILFFDAKDLLFASL